MRVRQSRHVTRDAVVGTWLPTPAAVPDVRAAMLIARRVSPPACAFAGMLLAGQVQAANIAVFPAGAVDDSANGNCSLVEAITSANNDSAEDGCVAGSGADTIVLPDQSSFNFSEANNNSVYGANALPLITSSIVLEGNGSTIRRTGFASTDFRIATVLGSGDLVVNRATLSGGVASSGGVVGSHGGAVLVFGGTASLTESSVIDNTANADGGGLANRSGNLTLTRSTVSGNTASADGGGIYSYTNLTTASTVISNSTISGNSATADGGGFYNYSGLTVISNSTITNNSAAQGSGAASFGDYVTETRVGTSIIAGNPGPDVERVGGAAISFSSEGDNLIGDDSNDGANAFVEPGDSTTSDPLLGSLRDNGGPTETHVPSGLSPATDAVTGTCPTPNIDQRGQVRALDGNQDGSAVCDIGAVERNVPILVRIDEDDPTDGNGRCSLTEAIENANDVVDGQPNADCSAGAPGGPDRILLPPGSTFTFTASGNNTDGPNALPSINSEIVIVTDYGGTFDDDAVIERSSDGGTPNFRLFHVATGGHLTLEKVRVHNGIANTPGLGSFGGGLFIDGGTVSITDSTISGHSAAADGGGIYNLGGSLALLRSTVSGNTAGTDGGGIHSSTNLTGDATSLDTSTLSGNTAGNAGGGLFNASGQVEISSSTIAANTADPSKGSGIASVGDAMTETHVFASLVAGNANSDVDLVSGGVNSFESGGSNLIGQGSGDSAFGEATDIADVADPLIGPLADNGGRTLTHLPADNSPAIDGAVLAFSFLGDQRGAVRPLDGDGDGGAVEDIGAVEYLPPIVVDNGEVADNDGNGLCSLVEAVENANSTTSSRENNDCGFALATGADTIKLPSDGLFTFTQSNDSTDGSNALPSITSTIAITGNGATIERSDANGTPAFRLVHVSSSGELTMEGVTVRNGSADASNGGGLFNRGSLTLENASVTDNSAINGGGIENRGSLRLTGVTVSGNTSNGGDGGGIRTNTDLTEFKATISNSTISGNSATRGGGLFNTDGVTQIVSSTVTGNTAPNGGGAGIGSFGDNVTETALLASIVAGNVGTDVDFVSGNANNSFTSNGNNLVGDGNATGDFNQSNDTTGVADPMLGLLSDNGGPTKTHRPIAGSPAIDRINSLVLFGNRVCLGVPAFDQRGVTRPQDGDLNNDSDCDIGAVEFIDDTVDSDGDGIPDGYELNNGLDPNDDAGDNGANGDLDMDGLPNIDEYDSGTAADSPDTDGDGLGDAIDRDSTSDTNACIDDNMGPAGAKAFDDTAMSGMTTQCGSESQITVRGTAILEVPDATLELFAPTVIFDTGFNVPLGTQLGVDSSDPTPP